VQQESRVFRSLVFWQSDEQKMAHIEPLIDAYEAAQILRLHPVTVREMAARREIPGLKIGKVWRFRASSLDEWVNSRLDLSSHPLSPPKTEDR
jgi:excisionase family DNA binding protein